MIDLDDREVEGTILSPVCTLCGHLKSRLDHRCDAFDRIPDEIWDGKNDHTKAYPGDHGVQFEPFAEVKP